MTTTGSQVPTLALVRQHATVLSDIATRHGIANIRVFGSVARGDAQAGSDLDLLVDVLPGHGLLALSAFAEEVEALVCIPTQAATMRGLKPRIRERVLAEAQLL